MASLVDENNAILAKYGVNPDGAVIAPAPTAVQQGQNAFRAKVQESASLEAQNRRIMEKYGVYEGMPDPTKAQAPAAPAKVVDVEKLQAAPAPKPIGGVQADPTKVKPIEGGFAGMGLGIAKAGENTWNLLNTVDDWVAKQTSGPDAKGIIEPSDYFKRLRTADDPITNLSAAVGQYVIPFFTGGAIANATSKAIGVTGTAAEYGMHLLSSGAVNAAVADPNGERFGALLGEHFPALQNPFFQWLKADEKDSAAEGQFKNFVDSVIVDTGLAGVVKAIPAGLKGIKTLVGEPTKMAAVGTREATQGLQRIMDANGIAAKDPEKLIAQIVETPQIKSSFEAQAAESVIGSELVVKDVSQAAPNPATLAGPQNKEDFAIMQAAQDYIEKIGTDKLRAKTTGPLTMEEIDNNALSIIADTPGFVNLIKGYTPGDVLAPDQLRAVQIFTTDLFDKMLIAEERAARSGLAVDIAYRDQKMAEFTTVAQTLVGGSEVAGRTLGVLSKATEGIDNKTKFKAAVAAVESMGGVNQGMLRIEQVRQLRTALKEGAGVQVMSALSKTGGSVMDAINYVALNGMTSSPKTAVRNFVAGIGKQVISVGSDLNIRAIGFIPGMGTDVELAAKIAQARIAGYAGSYKEATSHALHTLETGEIFVPSLYSFEKRLSTAAEQEEMLNDRSGVMRAYFSSLVNSVQKKIELVGSRLNKTQDSFNGMVMMRRSIIEDAVIEGTQAGLPEQGINDLIQLRMTSPTKQSWEKAQRLAAETTMALDYKDLLDGHQVGQNIGRAMQNLDASLAAVKLNFVVPFLKARVNEIAQTLEVLPGIGFLAPRTWAAMKQGGPARVEALAKMATTAEIMAGSMALMSMSGYSLTGSGPADDNTNKALRDTEHGYQPFSLRTTSGEYVSYSGMGILTNALKMVGNYQEISAQLPPDQRERLAWGMAAHLADTLTPSQLTQDLPNLFNALADLGPRGDGKAISKFLGDTAAKMLPLSGLMKTAAQEVDQNKRETVNRGSAWDTFFNQIKAIVPGYSRQLPPQRNIFGDVVYYPSGLGPDIASPFYVSQGDSEVGPELRRLGIYNTKVVQMPEGATPLELGMPMRTLTFNIPGAMGKIDLNAHQYDRLVQFSAGLNIPSEAITDSEAIDAAGMSYEDRQRMMDKYTSGGTLTPLKDAIKNVLGEMDNGTYDSELQKDEMKRYAVKSVVSDYQKLGRSAMFLDMRNTIEMQRQMINRAKVLKGEQ